MLFRSLMNKGLEVIEAMRLYRLPVEQVEAVIHRQSIVHSLVEFRDGAMLAQLGGGDYALQLGWGLGLSVLSSALNGLLAWVMLRASRMHRSITLEADGRITLRGTDLLSRAEGANRVQGASVQLN